MTQPPSTPQPYDDAVETIGEDEAKTAQAITDEMLKITSKTYEDSGHAIRSVHAKSHGILKARFEVLPDLPPVLAQGLFARAGAYDAILRFSTIPGDILPDKVSTPRGLAMKVIGVEGERAPGSKEQATQDFVMVNGPNFSPASPKAFLANLKFVGATTDKLEGVKEALSAVARPIEKLAESLGAPLPPLVALGGQQPRHILGETFFAQLPLRYGDYIAKFSLAPVSPELLALEHATVDLDADPQALRQAVLHHFELTGGEWELRVQLCADLATMPVEGVHPWDEAQSPFIPVARVTAAPQRSWSPKRAEAVDDGMGFSPWHALAAHRPLGALMRMRRLAYDSSQAFRTARNARPVSEPTSGDAVPD